MPKDDPSTPAVVISDAALRPTPASPDRTRITQTLPGQTRSSPIVAPVPVAPVSAVSSLDDDEPLPELRSRRRGPLLVAGVVLLGGAALFALKPSSDARNAESPGSPQDSVVKTAVAPAAPVAPPAAVSASPEAEPVVSAAPAPRVPAADAAERARAGVAPRAEPAPAKPIGKKTTSSSAPRKSKSETKSTTTEPGPSKPKGVIVRETPF